MKRLTIVLAVIALLASACGSAEQPGQGSTTAPVESTVPEAVPAVTEPAAVMPATEAPAPTVTQATSDGVPGPVAIAALPAPESRPPAAEPPAPEPPRWGQVDISLSEDVPFHRQVSGVAADDVLNVRSKPGPSEPIIGALAPGVTICVTGVQADHGASTWFEIHSPAGKGWVHGAYLAPVEGAEPAAFEGGTETVQADGSGFAFLTDIRMGSHQTFDRLVFDLEPQREHGGTPEYVVGYVEPPFIGVPANAIPVAGRAFLGVLLRGATTWDWENRQKSYPGPWRVQSGTVNITEVVITEDFEADIYLAVGLNDRAPFHATMLTDPLRLVVDIAHTDRAAQDPVLRGTVAGDGTGFGWLVDASLGSRDGFDRFVLEFSPDYMPTWADEDYRAGVPKHEVTYTSTGARGCDDRPDVSGNAFVMVTIEGATDDWDDPDVEIYRGQAVVTGATGNVVEAELVNECHWPYWIIGLDHQAPFTVTVVDGPPRLVIDIQH